MDLTTPRDDWPQTPWDRPRPFILSDDPADHGLSEAEVACIEKAYELRRREVRAALEQPSLIPSPTGGCPSSSGRRA